MKIDFFDLDNKPTNEFCDLTSYLSQIVACKTDEKIEHSHSQYEKSKELLSLKKKEFSDFFNEYSILEKEYAKENILNRILKTINTLKKEGLIVGSNISTIKKLLTNVNNMDLEKLVRVESRLARYIP